MPDVKYVFRAEDRTAGTIAQIRRRIDGLAGRGANVKVSVQAEGLDSTKREIEDLPERKSIRIDTEIGSEAGTQAIENLPERHGVIVNVTEGEQSGALAVRNLPDNHGVTIDMTVGDDAGSTAISNLPTVHGVVIDTAIGSDAGIAPLRQLPDSDSVTIDYDLGGTAGIIPLRDLPESDAVTIDYDLGGTAGIIPLRDLPESDAVRIDYDLGGTAGIIPLRDLPESDSVRIDYNLGGTEGIIDLPDSEAITVDYELGAATGIDPIRNLPERVDVVIDATMGEQTGIAPLALLPERMSVIIDAETGSELGISAIRDLPTQHGVVIDTEIGSEAGIQAIRDLPDSHMVRIDTELGDAQGLLALQTIPESISVTVDATAGGTVSRDDLVTGDASAGGGGGVGDMAVGGGVVAGAVLLGSKVVNAATALEERWMDQEQALADVSAMASSQFGGQALSADQMSAAMGEAQRISQTYDISTGQALGVMYMGMQQGRTFGQMTSGGLGEAFVQTSQASKGFGMSTLETLPYVLASGTDVLDVLSGSLDERMQTMQKLQLGWVGGGKGDISNFGTAHGIYSGAAYAEGWSPEESMGFMLSGLGGFARVGPAATGMRNILRDVQTGQGRDKWMESATDAGFVDESGQLSFLNEQGQMKLPLELMEELRKFNDPAIANQRSKLMFEMFSVEAKQFIDFLLATSPEAKYAQVLEQMGVVDAATMAKIKTDTATGGAAVLEGRREDAMSQGWQMLGGPDMTTAWQGAQNKALDDIQEMFDFGEVKDALNKLATPDMFRFFEEKGLAVRAGPGKMGPENYALGGAYTWRSPEKLEELNQLHRDALSYERPLAPVSAFIHEMGPSIHTGTREPAQHALPGGRGTGTGTGTGTGSYDVVTGDTLGEIAKKHGTTVEALLEANTGITNRDLITVGQQLAIPGQGGTEPPLGLGPLPEFPPGDAPPLPLGPLPELPPGDAPPPIVTPAWEYGELEPGTRPLPLGPLPLGPLPELPPGDAPRPWQPRPGPMAATMNKEAAQGIAAFVSMMTGILDPTTDASVEVRAVVTELDTSAVENQIISIGARLNIAPLPGDIGGGGTVRQDGSTQQRNAVNSSVHDSNRQRSGGAGGGSVGERLMV